MHLMKAPNHTIQQTKNCKIMNRCSLYWEFRSHFFRAQKVILTSPKRCGPPSNILRWIPSDKIVAYCLSVLVHNCPGWIGAAHFWKKIWLHLITHCADKKAMYLCFQPNVVAQTDVACLQVYQCVPFNHYGFKAFHFKEFQATPAQAELVRHLWPLFLKKIACICWRHQSNHPTD